METSVTKTLWSLANASGALGLSSVMVRQIRSRTDFPQPRAERDGELLYDADELIAWITKIRRGLRRDQPL